MQRISINNMSSQYLSSLNHAYSKQSKLQEQLSSGKRINRLSDDPIGISRSLRLRSNLAQNSKYLNNASDAVSWMQSTDEALQTASSVLIKAKELVVQAANDTNTAKDREAIGEQIYQLVNTLVDLGNSDLAGHYLFAGQDDRQEPFHRNGDGSVSFNGDNNKISMRLQAGAVSPQNDAMNVTCANAFGVDLQMFNQLNDIAHALKNGSESSEWLSSVALSQIDANHQRVIQANTELGARMDSFMMTGSMLENKFITIKSDISYIEDVDMAQAISEFKLWETVYQASLQMGAKVLPMSLANFI